jgi:hypothetical protein
MKDKYSYQSYALESLGFCERAIKRKHWSAVIAHAGALQSWAQLAKEQAEKHKPRKQ